MLAYEYRVTQAADGTFPVELWSSHGGRRKGDAVGAGLAVDQGHISGYASHPAALNTSVGLGHVLINRPRRVRFRANRTWD